MAYIHLQKDKRTGIGSHMEKAIFVGYLEGYKAWRFYNPITKRFVISERAEFDERYYPGLSMKMHQEMNPLPNLLTSDTQEVEF